MHHACHETCDVFTAFVRTFDRTIVAQLLYNSAGQLIIDNSALLGCLIVSALCSTVAFALFEASTIFRLHDLMALDVSTKQEIGADKLIKRGFFVVAVSSLINFLLVLFLAGIFGERPKSGKEVILATQRELEQQALERWKLQKEAQIEHMMHDGVPLGAVAAAFARPETAERIVVLESATTGGLSALDAARLTLRRAGWYDTTLDGLERVLGDSPRKNTASHPRLTVATGALNPAAHGRTWTTQD